MTTDWVRQKREAAPPRHAVIGPEPCPLPTAAVASELYGGTRSDDKLRKALFPVFVWRVALNYLRGDLVAGIVISSTPSALSVLRASATRAVLHSGANGKHPLQG